MGEFREEAVIGKGVPPVTEKHLVNYEYSARRQELKTLKVVKQLCNSPNDPETQRSNILEWRSLFFSYMPDSTSIQGGSGSAGTILTRMVGLGILKDFPKIETVGLRDEAKSDLSKIEIIKGQEGQITSANAEIFFPEKGGNSLYKASFELSLDPVKVFAQILRVRREIKELALKRKKLRLEKKSA